MNSTIEFAKVVLPLPGCPVSQIIIFMLRTIVFYVDT